MMTSPELNLPSYDPEKVTAGIAHFGVGNFHRSHQAMYLDRLIELGGHDNWGIIGIGVMPGDIRMRDALANQNFAYTLVEKSTDGDMQARVIRSILGMLYAPDSPPAVCDFLTDPSIKIVSLTITEGGYNIHRSTGEFDLASPVIQRDLADPDNPTTVFGYITEALRLRRKRGDAPFTVMSCDNLPGNGDVTRHAILSYSAAFDPDLAAWIGDNVAFPNSMVDRITPVTTDTDRELVKEVFGIEDAWPVITEPFTQWVLEDRFCNCRPDFERVGIQLVKDVAPYELMKLRLLNASHQAMAYVGLLHGYTFVHEAVADDGIEQFLRAYLAEARVTLSSLPGVNVNDYIETLFERFRNPYIADTLARLAVDASDRIPKFVLPVMHDNLAANRGIGIAAAVVASWAQYLAEASSAVIDPMAAELTLLAREADPFEFIRYVPVFGNLAENNRFVESYSASVTALRTSSLQDWLKQTVTR